MPPWPPFSPSSSAPAVPAPADLHPPELADSAAPRPLLPPGTGADPAVRPPCRPAKLHHFLCQCGGAVQHQCLWGNGPWPAAAPIPKSRLRIFAHYQFRHGTDHLCGPKPGRQENMSVSKKAPASACCLPLCWRADRRRGLHLRPGADCSLRLHSRSHSLWRGKIPHRRSVLLPSGLLPLHGRYFAGCGQAVTLWWSCWYSGALCGSHSSPSRFPDTEYPDGILGLSPDLAAQLRHLLPIQPKG